MYMSKKILLFLQINSVYRKKTHLPFLNQNKIFCIVNQFLRVNKVLYWSTLFLWWPRAIQRVKIKQNMFYINICTHDYFFGELHSQFNLIFNYYHWGVDNIELLTEGTTESEWGRLRLRWGNELGISKVTIL